VRPPTTTWPLLGAAVLSGILFTGSIATVGAAQTASTLASQAGAPRVPESKALLQLYAAEASLARAQLEQASLETRSSELARAEADARLRTEIVRRSLDASQRRVATLLRQLYIQGEPDPIAVILGATSIAYPIGPYFLSLVSNRWEDSTTAAALIGAIAIVGVTAVAYVGIRAAIRDAFENGGQQ